MQLGSLVRSSVGSHIATWTAWHGETVEMSFSLSPDDVCLVVDLESLDGIVGVKILNSQNKAGWIGANFLIAFT